LTLLRSSATGTLVICGDAYRPPGIDSPESSSSAERGQNDRRR
jgi:hypothetical protein